MPGAFQNLIDNVDSPARSAFTVTPSDTDLVTTPKALYVGTGGNVVVILADDTTSVTLKSVQAGQILPVRPRRVLPGTTATDIIALA